MSEQPKENGVKRLEEKVGQLEERVEQLEERVDPNKRQHFIVATPTALLITFNNEQQRRAHQCLARSGKITFSFKEISVTSLPETLLDNGVIVD